MNALQTTFSEDYEFSVEPAACGRIKVQVVMPESLLKSFMMLLSSLSDMLKHLQRRNKIIQAQVSAYSADSIAKLQKHADLVDSDILSTFKGFLSHNTPKECISLTLLALKDKHPNICYDSVRHVASKAGYFKRVKS